jgi:hypothetical protein
VDAGYFTVDSISEPFPEGTYYLNSVIQNAGTGDAVCQDADVCVEIFLNDTLYRTGGWGTSGRQAGSNAGTFDLTQRPQAFTVHNRSGLGLS